MANIDSAFAYAILMLFESEGGSDAYQVGLGHFLKDLGLHVVTLPAAIHLHNLIFEASWKPQPVKENLSSKFLQTL